MEKRTIKYIRIIFVLLLSFMLLTGCGYTEADIESARQQAYNDGYDDGYYRGVNEQQEEDYEGLLIDGWSIRDIVDKVYDEFGMTPRQAFMIFDDYVCDSDHGGYTWDEYQKAIEAMYYTACIIPNE